MLPRDSFNVPMDECWLGGEQTNPQRRRVLNTSSCDHILSSLRRIGVPEHVLPTQRTIGGDVFACRPCFSELERLAKLHKDVDKVCESILSKLSHNRNRSDFPFTTVTPEPEVSYYHT